MKCKGLNGRSLRNRITINSIAYAADANGDMVETPTKLATVKAHRKERAAGEMMRGEGVLARRKTIYTIRYRDDITPQMTITDGSTTRNITDVIETGNGRNQFMELHCLEDAG